MLWPRMVIQPDARGQGGAAQRRRSGEICHRSNLGVENLGFSAFYDITLNPNGARGEPARYSACERRARVPTRQIDRQGQ